MKVVPVTYNNSDSRPLSYIDPSIVEATDAAFCTNRVLEGSEDAGYAQEWCERARLPDGRNCLRVYLFSSSDLVDGNGDPLVDEDLPWDDDHVVRIRLID